MEESTSQKMTLQPVSEEDQCGSFQCSIVKLHDLHPVTLERVLEELGSRQPGDPAIYDEDVEEEEAIKMANICADGEEISRDFPTLSQGRPSAAKNVPCVR